MRVLVLPLIAVLMLKHSDVTFLWPKTHQMKAEHFVYNLSGSGVRDVSSEMPSRTWRILGCL